MALFLAPICNDQTFDANGDPLVSGQIETYIAESSTPAATYTDDTGGTPQSNPIILNSLGYPTLGAIWLTGGVSYKFIIKNAAGSTLRTIDNISGVNDASVSQSEWVESGLVPTYISGTSFSVPGDQTALLQIGRRLRTTNTSGLVYSTISNSVFAAGITTVTLTNDSTTLDAGLSLIAYALLAADPLSVPNLPGTKITGAYTASGLTMATARMLGRITASTGAAEELTAAQVAAFTAAASTTAQGAVELATSAEAITGTDATRAITPSTMKAAQIVLGTSVTASGTSMDRTGIPTWANVVNVMLDRISTNGSSPLLLQLGATSVETTGYQGNGARFQNAVATDLAASGAGFIINKNAAADTVHGFITLRRLTGNTWGCSATLGCTGNAYQFTVGGQKALAGVLDRIRLTTSGGVDTFDDGSLNVSWE